MAVQHKDASKQVKFNTDAVCSSSFRHIENNLSLSCLISNQQKPLHARWNLSCAADAGTTNELHNHNPIKVHRLAYARIWMVLNNEMKNKCVLQMHNKQPGVDKHSWPAAQSPHQWVSVLTGRVLILRRCTFVRWIVCLAVPALWGFGWEEEFSPGFRRMEVSFIKEKLAEAPRTFFNYIDRVESHVSEDP